MLFLTSRKNIFDSFSKRTTLNTNESQIMSQIKDLLNKITLENLTWFLSLLALLLVIVSWNTYKRFDSLCLDTSIFLEFHESQMNRNTLHCKYLQYHGDEISRKCLSLPRNSFVLSVNSHYNSMLLLEVVFHGKYYQNSSTHKTFKILLSPLAMSLSPARL